MRKKFNIIGAFYATLVIKFLSRFLCLEKIIFFTHFIFWEIYWEKG